MTISIKAAFAIAILMSFGAFPAFALEAGQCTAWKPALGSACMTRKCAIGQSPAIHLVPETVCPGASIPTRRPAISPNTILPGTSRGSTAD